MTTTLTHAGRSNERPFGVRWVSIQPSYAKQLDA